ncbi:MAG: hypothetical protein U9Q66_00985 [Patescibacteria group bacterium]|nr:hypothetical protein [Patescibacteria group bacterium]
MKELFGKVGDGYSKFMVILGYVSTVFLLMFYNPGYSYLHIMMDLEASYTGSYIAMLFLGFILLLPTILDLPKAWEATGKMDKAIFIIGSIFAAVTVDLIFETVLWQYWVLLAEFSVIGFMLWGSYVMHRYMSKYRTLGTKEQGTQDVNVDNADELSDDCNDCDLDQGAK